MSKATTDQAEAIVVPVKVLEKAFGIKERRVRQLAQEGILVKSGHGRYNFIESVINYITHLKANIEIKNLSDEDSKIDYDEEHALHEKAKRIKAELELQVMSGQLHEADIIEKVMTDMLSNFRARILALPSKIAPIIQIENNISKIQTIIKDACMEALHELAEYDPEKFYSDKHIKIVEDDEGFEDGEEIKDTDT